MALTFGGLGAPCFRTPPKRTTTLLGSRFSGLQTFGAPESLEREGLQAGRAQAGVVGWGLGLDEEEDGGFGM